MKSFRFLLEKINARFSDFLIQEAYFSVHHFIKNTNYIDEKMDLLEQKAIQFCVENNIPVSYNINNTEKISAGVYAFYFNNGNPVPIEITVDHAFFFKSKEMGSHKDKKYLRSRLIHTLYHEIGHHLAIKFYHDRSEEKADYEGMKFASTFLEDIDMILLNIHSHFFSNKDDDGSILLFKSKEYRKKFKKVQKCFNY